jgi:hypothetical protein
MLVDERDLNGGNQKIYRFDNGYGASVVNHSYSYGTELAVLKFKSENNFDFELNYDTPITDDVIGHLHEAELENILKDIENLNEEGQYNE